MQFNHLIQYLVDPKNMITHLNTKDLKTTISLKRETQNISGLRFLKKI